MKHERLLAYEGDDEWVGRQISNSLPEGERHYKDRSGGMGRITVYIVTDGICFLEKLKIVIVRLLDKLIHQQRR